MVRIRRKSPGPDKWFLLRPKKETVSAVNPKEQQIMPLTKAYAPLTAGSDCAPKSRLRP